jgi:hypothetical protein
MSATTPKEKSGDSIGAASSRAIMNERKSFRLYWMLLDPVFAGTSLPMTPDLAEGQEANSRYSAGWQPDDALIFVSLKWRVKVS